MSAASRPPRTGRACLGALWAVALAALASGADWSAREIAQRAADRPMFLVPRDRPGEARRQELLSAIRARPQIRSVEWLSPSRLAQEAVAALPKGQWGELFSDEEAWLPWVAEANLKDPLWNRRAASAMAAELKSDAAWRVALWDESALDRDWRALSRMLIICGVGGFWVLALGAAALRAIPRAPGGWFGEAATGAAATAAILLSLGAALGAAGLPPDGQAWRVALGAGLGLAGLFAPMIKGRDASARPETPTKSEV